MVFKATRANSSDRWDGWTCSPSSDYASHHPSASGRVHRLAVTSKAPTFCVDTASCVILVHPTVFADFSFEARDHPFTTPSQRHVAVCALDMCRCVQSCGYLPWLVWWKTLVDEPSLSKWGRRRGDVGAPSQSIEISKR